MKKKVPFNFVSENIDEIKSGKVTKSIKLQTNKLVIKPLHRPISKLAIHIGE